MIACLSDHSTQWIQVRGDERALEVSGLGQDDQLKLAEDRGGAVTETALTVGLNPFPAGLTRFMVRKRCSSGAVGSPTTVKVRTR